jgi:hypothetical protein
MTTRPWPPSGPLRTRAKTRHAHHSHDRERHGWRPGEGHLCGHGRLVLKPLKTDDLDAALRRWTHLADAAPKDVATEDGVPTPEPPESGDVGTIERTSHTLNGSAGKLGVARMAETARLLEEAGRAGDPLSVAGLLQRLDTAFEEARAEFSALLLKR